MPLPPPLLNNSIAHLSPCKPFPHHPSHPSPTLLRPHTVAVTKTGVTRLSLPPVWYSAEKVKSKVEITNDETKALLTKSLKAPKKKSGGAAAAGGDKKAAAEEKK